MKSSFLKFSPCLLVALALHPANSDAALINVAVGKSTTASTELNASFTSDLAVDGDNSDASFFHTRTNDFAPFWEVDLGAEYPIEDIRLYNRGNGSGDFGTRLNNVLVEVRDAANTQVYLSSLFNPWDGTGTPVNPGQGPHAFDPAGAVGRHVRVYKDPAHDGSEWLPLAEVEVMVDSANVPEPTTLLLAGVGLMVAAGFRRANVNRGEH